MCGALRLSSGNSPTINTYRSMKENTMTAAASAEALRHQSCSEDVVFLRKIHIGIFVLGLELGFLLQGSTIPIQYTAIRWVPDDSATQLLLSLLWSYILATTGLGIFFLCQRYVYAFLHLLQQQEVFSSFSSSCQEEHQQMLKDHQHQHHHHRHHNLLLLEAWKVDLQCYFAQGSVLGVFLSWLFVDRVLNHKTRVLYGGIMFLGSLLYILRQLWRKYGCLQEYPDLLHDELPVNELLVEESGGIKGHSSSSSKLGI